MPQSIDPVIKETKARLAANKKRLVESRQRMRALKALHKLSQQKARAIKALADAFKRSIAKRPKPKRVKSKPAN